MFLRYSCTFMVAILGLGSALTEKVQADPILLFNTGVNASGSLLPVGATDPHWSIVTSTTVSTPTPAIVMTPVGGYATSPGSAWIWTNASGSGGGNHTFRLSFDLTGFNPATAMISGAWGIDNTGRILLNGATPIGSGTFNLPSVTTDNFTRFHGFSIVGGFVSGINTLEFVVTDADSLGGLNVNSLVGTATPTAVPEPSSIVLMGLGGLCLAWRRRRANVA